ncbi:helix-turn-helix domain-containing protein [Mycobacterium gordonae]|nr:helix-turn-helix domain-containing protein [Mycobacterium gordonae]
MPNISERVRRLREDKGLSMNELEDAIGASRGSVHKWEKGSIPGGKSLIALSDFFSVSTDFILKGKEAIKHTSPLDPPFSDPLLPYESELLLKMRMLSLEDRLKVEGIIEGILMTRGSQQQQQMQRGLRSPGLKNTELNGREEAAGKSESA